MKKLSLIRREQDPPKKRLFCYSSSKSELFLRYISNEKDENLKGDRVYSEKIDSTHLKKQNKLTFFLLQIEIFNIAYFFPEGLIEEEKNLNSGWLSRSHNLGLEHIDKLFK